MNSPLAIFKTSLMRASELAGQRTTGEAAHNLEEVVELRNYCGRVELVRLRGDRRCFRRREWVVKVLDRWREVGRWWDEARYVDRMVFRVLLCGEKVVDLAQERSGDWILVGVAD